MLASTATSHRAGRVEWKCDQCGYSCPLDVATEAVVTYGGILGIIMNATSAAQREADKEAERKFKLAQKLVACPTCGYRLPGPRAWLIAQVVTIGVFVGLIGLFAGTLVPVFLERTTRTNLLVGAVGGWILGTALVAWITYRRRMSDVARWTKFRRLGE